MKVRAALFLVASLSAGLGLAGCRGLTNDVACLGDEHCPEALPFCLENADGPGHCAASPPGKEPGDGGLVDGGELDGGLVDGGGNGTGPADGGEDGGITPPDDGGDVEPPSDGGDGGSPCVAVGDHLVVNEVDYDQPGADPAEFVEILNPSCEPIALGGIELVLVNGSDDFAYLRVPLDDAAPTLGPRQHLVIAEPEVEVAPGALVIELVNMEIQNGDRDGAVLFDAAALRVIDSLTWEGENISVLLDGVEISATEGGHGPFESDDGQGDGALIRFPDGRDSDDNYLDWAATFTPTPGAPNVRTPLWPDSASAACSDGTQSIPCPNDDSLLALQDGSVTRVAPELEVEGNVVRDLRTGLVWHRVPSPTPVSSAVAVSTCAFLEAGGRGDWRQPTARELVTLLDLGKPGRKLDATFFELSLGAVLWSGTQDTFDSAFFWALDTASGLLEARHRDELHTAFCVTEVPALPPMKLIQPGDGSALRDVSTRLAWETTRSSTPLSWSAAFARCRDLALDGFEDWRLPTAKELYSLVDFAVHGPAVSSVLFPGTPSAPFVTATPSADDPTKIMAVDFTDGAGTLVTASAGGYVRCVRGGDEG